MADIEVSVETEEQFWDELREIVTVPQCDSHETIDDSLRSWLYLVSTCRDTFLHSEDDVATCSQMLIDSQIFCGNQEYVRTQIMYSLLQEDDPSALNVIANFLLLDGRSDEATFKSMIDEGCFPKLVELIKSRRDDDRRLHRLLLELMYEMARIERLRLDDLLCVDDDFVIYMFQLIEGLSDDVNDPYHYPIIRVLLVMNEQYMVAATTAAVDASTPAVPITNRVIKILSLHGPSFRTFGENIILLLNRETETSLQLLILKLLYLLFTTKGTYEYFYTNDLRVLLDVIIRNLLDLPDESMSLRHTYLRVLYPLLAHTQLSHPPHYKREEILKVLSILSGEGSLHFAPADETTLRLVDRVSKVRWLGESAEGEVARKFLGISLSHAQTQSNVSVVDVAAVMEKPGVKTPSRSRAAAVDVVDAAKELAGSAPATGAGPRAGKEAAPKPKKVLPAVPRHRHGKPTTPLPPKVLVNDSGNNNKNSASGINNTSNINSTSISTSNGGPPAKKLPPKTPPPRRTRLRAAEACSEPPPPAPAAPSAQAS
ncbi:putative ldb17 protein [Diaporthe ampelina]|uniref:Putative ldb17 protein n=1 Tax=Diaporthe ampelina TaxID=1214573 RepID=A0A0G2HNR9_9PEZI|nr:putative ldb17 protein [Diaporthe ampelina]